MKNWLTTRLNHGQVKVSRSSSNGAERRKALNNNKVTSIEVVEPFDDKELKGQNVAVEVELSQMNDAILMAIFSHLPLKERINVQRVNKRWTELISNLWLSQKALSFGFSPGRNFEASFIHLICINYLL